VNAAGAGLVRTALARVEDWLLEPVEPLAPAGPRLALTPRPVVAVFSLGRGSGATMVARALAAELGRRDPAGAAVVGCALPRGGIPLASAAAGRLARALIDLPGARTRVAGRLCLVEAPGAAGLVEAARQLAPVVLDGGGEELGGVSAGVADRTVLVTAAGTEPSLAAVAAGCLARAGPTPVLAVNRVRVGSEWAGPPAIELPESRMGAQLALGGREPRGELGRAVGRLADACALAQAP
jgi:hypothetical protein